MATNDIRAPFNFIPLSEKVYFPDWADQISHDIPFSDGISGWIEFKVIAETPLFVRNGHTQYDSRIKDQTYKSFCHLSGKGYFIPGTSIKGSIRNALEILSFSKLTQLDNQRYSIRDLQLAEYREIFQNSDIHCGWMTKNSDTNTISITDNGIPYRISHKQIDELLGTSFCQIFSNKEFLKSDSHRSPLIKYEMVAQIRPTSNLKSYFKGEPINKNNPSDRRKGVVLDSSGFEGTIVFTGQPSHRRPAINGKKASGKFYEFVFPEKVIRERPFQLDYDDERFNDFCFIYNGSQEWEHWKSKLEQGERIPVFFITAGGKLLHFGLSYLYKLPYPKRLKDYLYSEHTESRADLSECIFGTADGNGNGKLKGRATFSNAFCIKGTTIPNEISPYLGSPRPTYYPIYIKQNGSDGTMQTPEGKGIRFQTMMDANAKLRGWKKYPIRDTAVSEFNIPDGQKENIQPFIPMETGSEFLCKLTFNNLRRVELGAILFALDLWTGCSHSLGFAKPFGFGRVRYELLRSNTDSCIDINALKQEFKNLMEVNIVNYSKSDQIREFKAMSRPQQLTLPLEYMTLKQYSYNKRQHFKNDRDQSFGRYQQDFSHLVIKNQQSWHQLKENAYPANVTASTGGEKRARLVNSKDNCSYPLYVPEEKIHKVKIKTGDTIIVHKICKGGNIIKLEFVSII